MLGAGGGDPHDTSTTVSDSFSTSSNMRGGRSDCTLVASIKSRPTVQKRGIVVVPHDRENNGADGHGFTEPAHVSLAA